MVEMAQDASFSFNDVTFYDTWFILTIDLLAILEESLDRAIFLYNFICEVRLSGVRASIAIVNIRKFYRM